jgi:hypothetical protein
VYQVPEGFQMTFTASQPRAVAEHGELLIVVCSGLSSLMQPWRYEFRRLQNNVCLQDATLASEAILECRGAAMLFKSRPLFSVINHSETCNSFGYLVNFARSICITVLAVSCIFLKPQLADQPNHCDVFVNLVAAGSKWPK